MCRGPRAGPRLFFPPPSRPRPREYARAAAAAVRTPCEYARAAGQAHAGDATTSGSGRACGVAADGGDACVRAACARLPCVCAAAVGRWALGPAVGQGFCILDMRCYAQCLQCTLEIFRILSAAGSHSATAVKVAGHSAMAISAGHGGSWTEHSLKTSGRENSS